MIYLSRICWGSQLPKAFKKLIRKLLFLLTFNLQMLFDNSRFSVAILLRSIDDIKRIKSLEIVRLVQLVRIAVTKDAGHVTNGFQIFHLHRQFSDSQSSGCVVIDCIAKASVAIDIFGTMKYYVNFINKLLFVIEA